MAISFVYAANTSGSDYGSTSIDASTAGILANDIIIATFYHNGSVLDTITWPAGFTVWGSIGPWNGIYRFISMAWKRATTESGVYAFSHSNPAQIVSAEMVVARGCKKAGDPAHKFSNTAYNTDDNKIQAAGVVTTIPCTLLWNGHIFDGTPTFTKPSGFTELRYIEYTIYHDTSLAYLDQTDVGSTGDVYGTVNSGTATAKAAFMVALEAEEAAVPTKPLVRNSPPQGPHNFLLRAGTAPRKRFTST